MAVRDLACFAWVATLLVACGGQSARSGGEGEGGTGGGTGGGANIGGGGGSGGKSGTSGGISGSSSGDAAGGGSGGVIVVGGSSPMGGSAGAGPCDRILLDTQHTRLNLFIVLDRSAPLAEARQALSELIGDPSLARTRVTLISFPGRDPAVCAAADCRSPACRNEDLAAGTLSGSSVDPQRDALLAALIASSVEGSPTLSAGLDLAILRAEQVARELWNELFSVLVISSGETAGCDVETVAVAERAYADLGVRVHVAAAPGSASATLDEIARGAGTESAVLLGDDARANLAALSVVQHHPEAVVSCRMALPRSATGEPADTTLINAELTTASGELLLPYKVAEPAHCGEELAYLTTDTELVLCPATCRLFASDAGARLTVVEGCR